MKSVLLTVLFISVTFSYNDEYCPCGPNYSFNYTSYTCQAYPNKHENGYTEGCRFYSLKAGQWECIVCKPQFIYDFDGCIDTGIPGCTSATLKTLSLFLSNSGEKYECHQCDFKNYYLQDYKCIKYPTKGEKHYIQGCKRYESQGKCGFCQQHYYKENNACKKPQRIIDNCKNYRNRYNCMNCDYGYILKNNQCVKYEKIIPNCQFAYYQHDGLFCEQCKQGYFYVKQKQICQANPSTHQEGKVNNCEVYMPQSNDTKIQCVKCNSAYSLSNDKTSCQLLNGQSVRNCDQYQTNAQGKQQCVQCQKYYSSIIRDNQIYQCKKCPPMPDQNLNQVILEQFDKGQAQQDIS